MVRPQVPLTLGDSEPEPDLAVVTAEEDAKAERHPQAALLVIEVADSSARRDLETKARIYAIPYRPQAGQRKRVRFVHASGVGRRGLPPDSEALGASRLGVEGDSGRGMFRGHAERRRGALLPAFDRRGLRAVA